MHPPLTKSVAAQPTPVTGILVPELSAFDELLTGFLRQHAVPGAALAVGRQGRVVYSRGFGWSDPEAREIILPDTRFRLASVSKSITAHAVMKLVDRGLLDPEDRVVDRLPAELIRETRTRADSRWERVRIRHLLQHTGGWDPSASGDPMFQPDRLTKDLGTTLPVTIAQIVRWMRSRPLDFEPGERYAYSNFGYCLLGRVIEQLTGENYSAAVRRLVFAPLSLETEFELGQTRREHRLAGETRYHDRDQKGRSVLPEDAGAEVPMPYGAWSLEVLDAVGGWVSTASAVLRWSLSQNQPEQGYLRTETWWSQWDRPTGPVGYTKEGSPRHSYYGYGWQTRVTKSGSGRVRWHAGGLDGTSTQVVDRDDGVSWVLLFNSRRTNEKSRTPVQLLDADMFRVADGVTRWP